MNNYSGSPTLMDLYRDSAKKAGTLLVHFTIKERKKKTCLSRWSDIRLKLISTVKYNLVLYFIEICMSGKKKTQKPNWHHCCLSSVYGQSIIILIDYRSYPQRAVSSLDSQWFRLQCCPLCRSQRASYRHQTLKRTKQAQWLWCPLWSQKQTLFNIKMWANTNTAFFVNQRLFILGL